MKKISIEHVKNRIAARIGAVYSVVIFPMTVYAGGLENITNGVTSIVTFITAIAAGVGVIIFIRNAMDFGNAIQDRDRNGMMSGLLGMIGGGVIGLAGTIATLFGIGG